MSWLPPLLWVSLSFNYGGQVKACPNSYSGPGTLPEINQVSVNENSYTWKQWKACPATACPSCLVVIDVLAFWEWGVEGGKYIIQTSFFHRRNRKGQMAASAALASEGLLMFSFCGNCITISKCHVDKCSSQPQFNTLQLCTAHSDEVPLCVGVCICVFVNVYVCKWMFAFYHTWIHCNYTNDCVM